MNAAQERMDRQHMHDSSASALSNLAKWLIVAAFLLLLLVFSVYVIFFHEASISNSPEDWGVFGDFIGGVANPVLSFLTVALLSVTVILQARQIALSSEELRLSRKELELTRAELSRTAAAQEMSEKALKSQADSAEFAAQISAINTLMEYLSREISTFDGVILMSGDPRINNLHELERRKEMLRRKLESFYSDLMGEEDDPEI